MARATVQRVVAALFALLSGVQAHAQIAFQEQYTKIVNGGESVPAYDGGLFGENVALATGATEFSTTDVSLPGNDALPVAFGRRRSIEIAGQHPRYLLGDWDIDVPFLEGIYGAGQGWISDTAKPAKRCSYPASADQVAPPNLSVGGLGLIPPRQFWQGIHLHAKAGDRQEILFRSTEVGAPTDGRAYRFVTSGFWHFACTPSLASGHPGDGFIARAPNGFIYTFDWMVVTPTSSVLWPRAGGNYSAERERVRLYPTRIEDRHGNWVDYHWAANRLLGIESSDGRGLTLTYDSTSRFARIKTVSDNSTPPRTWQYHYAGDSLSGVTLPDGSAWGLDFGAIGIGAVNYSTDTTNIGFDTALPCNWMRKLLANEREVRISHPSGALGRFTFDVKRHGRANVESFCFNDGADNRTHFPETPARYDTWSLVRKRIEGPGLPGSLHHPDTVPYEWTYGYTSPVGNFTTSPCSGGCGTTKTTEVRAPDGSRTQHVYGIEFAHTDGQLLSMRVLTSGGNEARRETYAYVQTGDSVAFPHQIGFSPQGYLNDAHVGANLRPQKERSIVQAGIAYTATTTAFDTFAYPTRVSRSSAYGGKTEVSAYDHNTSKWVLGQRHTLEVDGVIVNRIDYDAVTALPMRAYAFGRELNSAEYYVGPGGNGALKSITDGNQNKTIFKDYFRGIARLVELPTGANQSAEVNNFGAITSITDELGNTRRFDYYPHGRLQRIRYPTGDDVAWRAREFDFQPAGAEYGVATGHWTQTVTHGTARKVTVLDALWRPVLIQEEDTAVAGSARTTVQRYDHDGRTTFASYPRAPLCPTCTVYSVATGTSSNFDVLGRLVGTSQSSELGDLGTTVTYAASGFSKTVRNARGKATTTHYRAYDEPVETWPIRIEMPESVVVDIDRDAFDAPRSITRSGSRLSNGVLLPVSATRSYVYDTQHQLCKTIEPEVGATVMGYDGAGNVSWTATGLNLPSGTQCDHGASSVAAVRSDRTYDAVNRPLDTTFADGSPSIRRTYWPDGQLKTLRTSGTNPADTTQWSYEYNARRLLTSETLSMDGTSYVLTNRYDGNGYLKTLVYPDLVEVDYAPDALGQQTRAGNSIKAYASNVTRWPNGAISGFTYGNGVVRSLEQNARGLPKRSRDAGVIDDTYAFDENANVSSIADAIAGTARTMQYDDLDRLESALAGSPWGNASYVYDAIDNLRSSSVKRREYAHVYDAANRLQSLDSRGVPQLEYAYSMGNVTRRGQQAFHFDHANRLVTKTGEGAATDERYTYDGHGRRVKIVRTASGDTRHMLYAQDGQLRFEANLATDTMTDYIMLGGSLVAREESQGSAVPAGPVVTAPSNNATGSFRITWAAPSGAASYVLEEKRDSAGWGEIYAGPDLLFDANLRGNGVYQYRAKACNASGCGLFGPSVTTHVAGVVPPLPPAMLAATPTQSLTGTFELRWPESAAATSYRVYENPNNAGWSTTPLHDGTARSLRITGRTFGSYRYRVVACGAGCGGPSPERQVFVTAPTQPVPLPPTLTVPSTSTTGLFIVGWTASAGAHSYQLQEIGPDAWTWGGTYSGPARTWSLSRPSGIYLFHVRACNLSGECGDYGAEQSIRVSVTGDFAAPEPLTITPESSTDGSATVRWALIGAATRYELEWNPNATGWTPRYSGPLLVRNEAGLANGEYKFRARACDSSRCGVWTAEKLLAVSRPGQAPPPVETLSAAPADSVDGNYTISWTPSVGATHYELDEKLRVGTSGGEWIYLGPTYAATSRSFSQRGNGTYDYRIRACKSGATPPCSGYGTAAATVRVVRPGGIEAPASIVGLNGCTEVGGGQTVTVPLAWPAVVGATRYEVRENNDMNSNASIIPSAGTYLPLLRGRGNNTEINYYHAVRACNAAMCSEWRGTAIACLVSPGTPRSVTSRVRYLHTDALGSPVAETDESGAVLKRTYHESYGAPIGGLYADGPGYTGHVTDSASGLTYMQQRYYDPLAGRFLSVDPIATDASTGGGFNRYTYARNNPLKNIDPDGRNPLNPLDAYDFAKDVGGLIVTELVYVAAVIKGDEAVANLALAAMSAGVFDAAVSTVGFVSTGGRQIKAMAQAADGASDAKKATGAYTVTHESGKKYHGKGGVDRMNSSAKRNEKMHADPAVKKEHTPIGDARQAFMEEARRIGADGGPGNGNYNRINSPGKKFLEEES